MKLFELIRRNRWTALLCVLLLSLIGFVVYRTVFTKPSLHCAVGDPVEAPALEQELRQLHLQPDGSTTQRREGGKLITEQRWKYTEGDDNLTVLTSNRDCGRGPLVVERFMNLDGKTCRYDAKTPLAAAIDRFHGGRC